MGAQRAARAVRELVLMGVLGPAMDFYTRRRVRRFFEQAGAETTPAERGPLAGATAP